VPTHPASTFSATIGACRRGLVYAGFFSLFINLLQIVIPLYMMQVFDRVLVSGSLETLALLSLIASAALVVMAALELVRSLLLNQVGVWVERRLGQETFQRSIEGALDGKNPTADGLRDLVALRSFFASPALSAVFDAPWVLVYLAILYLLHPVLAAIALSGAIFLLVLALLNDRVTRVPLIRSSHEARHCVTQVQTALRSAEVIDALGMLSAVGRAWASTNQRSVAWASQATSRAALIVALSKFARLFIQLVLLGVGAVLVMRQELTAGAMIGGSIMMSRALAPIEQAIGAWKQLVSTRSSYLALKALFAAPSRRPLSPMRLPRPAGRLELERVTLAFAHMEKPVLRAVSFAVAPGEVVALVGPSAAGKSSLARLMVGTWKPTTGVVRLDGADVFAMNREDFGRHVGYLPQTVELFNGTVRDNIARLSEAGADEVIAAARLAGVHDMILRLPQGYQTEVGVGGSYLSGGQRQRIGLARALFGQPRLVVLDEPNAHLDHEGEQALIKAIESLRQQQIAVAMIAHRPGVLRVADRVVLLIDGTIQMIGTTDEVLAQLTRPPPPAAATPGSGTAA